VTFQRHPLNAEFEWTEHRGPFRLLTERQAKQFDDQGYIILRDVIPQTSLQELTNEIDPLTEESERFLEGQPNGEFMIAKAGAINFTVHIVTRSEAAKRFCASRFFQDLCHDIIGPDVRLYWDQAVYKRPQPGRQFPWHQDNGYTFVAPQSYVTCWIPLTDATIENGCPWVMPGIHHQGTLNHKWTKWGWDCFTGESGIDEKGVAAPVKAGDALVFSSLTPHRTGPNQTDATRKAYIVQFAPEGAQILDKDGTKTPANAPDRQYVILKDGERISV